MYITPSKSSQNIIGNELKWSHFADPESPDLHHYAFQNDDIKIRKSYGGVTRKQTNVLTNFAAQTHSRKE